MSLLSMVLLQLFDAGILMPILNRLTGSAINYSGFANLQGNPSLFLSLLLPGWSLAAFGEEGVYRDYLQKLLGSFSELMEWLSWSPRMSLNVRIALLISGQFC